MLAASISACDLEPEHERGEIGYWCGRGAAARRDGRGLRRSLARLGASTSSASSASRSAPTCDNIGSQRIAGRGRLPARGRPARPRCRCATGATDDVLLRASLPRRPAARRAAGAAAGTSLGWPRLTDGRLVVRPFEPDDAPAVQAACDDPDVAHWIFGLPAPYSLADAERFIADARRRLAAGERARLAVTDAATGELLGSVSLDLFADRQAAEIGYWVKREARRRGVALGAARLVVDWAFGDLGIERLELLTYPGNEASQALAGRLGFTRECLLRGFLAPEAGKSREGRVVPSADGSLPPRDDQVQFVRLRSDPAPPA